MVVDGGPSVLDMSKVLFIKSVNPLDREKFGLLLETIEGLTADWAMVRPDHKRCIRGNANSVVGGKKTT